MAARRHRVGRPGFALEGFRQADADDIAVGFTVTKKIGGAVVRNRLKRRLRAVARDVVARCGAAGWRYVLVGRRDGLTRPFAALLDDLEAALLSLHSAAGARRPTPARRGKRDS